MSAVTEFDPASLKDLDPETRAIIEAVMQENKELSAKVEEGSKRQPKSILAILDDAMHNQERVKGRNKAFVELVNHTGVTYPDGTTVTSEELKGKFIEMLRLCPGVRVVEKDFELVPTYCQFNLTVYNRREVTELSAQLGDTQDGS